MDEIYESDIAPGSIISISGTNIIVCASDVFEKLRHDDGLKNYKFYKLGDKELPINLIDNKQKKREIYYRRYKRRGERIRKGKRS